MTDHGKSIIYFPTEEKHGVFVIIKETKQYTQEINYMGFLFGHNLYGFKKKKKKNMHMVKFGPWKLMYGKSEESYLQLHV